MKFAKPFYSILILLLVFFCVLMIRLSWPYHTLRFDVDFLLTKQSIIHIRHWRYSFYIHVFLSIFALIAGLTQFSDYILKKRKRLHRFMGYVYVTDVLLLAGPSALIMSFYANGTAVSKASFVLLSLLWMVFTGLALREVKRKNFKAHKNWMIRSYALTLSAISLRLYALFLPKIIHLSAHEEYAVIAWASWTINLLVAELIIYTQRKSTVLLA